MTHAARNALNSGSTLADIAATSGLSATIDTDPLAEVRTELDRSIVGAA